MDEFFDLSADEQKEVLAAAASASGRPAHLLEKDIWVVWALNQLFSSAHAQHLVFKGGTSLSKAYQVIRRFSEDVDLTYDIRALIPDLVKDKDPPIPTSRNQASTWTDAVRGRLPELVTNEFLPLLSSAAKKLNATVRAQSDKVFIEYQEHSQGTGYVQPSILLEFGARSTGEPHEMRSVSCDAAQHLPDIAFPTASPIVMLPQRTFWEKATAMHVFCAQGSFRGGERFSRHWHDVVRLDDAGYADKAIADTALGKAVADHKNRFFVEKDNEGKQIDYQQAVGGALHLVPTADARAKLRTDYGRMVDDGLLLDDAEAFDTLIERCESIQRNANEKKQRFQRGQPKPLPRTTS